MALAMRNYIPSRFFGGRGRKKKGLFGMQLGAFCQNLVITAYTLVNFNSQKLYFTFPIISSIKI